MPIRIQRLRKKDWKMPENTIYVGRPSFWGNPFRVLRIPTHEICVVIKNNHLTRILDANCKSELEATKKAIARYEVYIKDFKLDSLLSKNLACWCPLDKPCHADVLLELLKRYEVKNESN